MKLIKIDKLKVFDEQIFNELVKKIEMDKSVTFTVDADVYEKFCIAMSLTNETKDVAAENCIRWYITKTFEKASQTYNPKTVAKQNEDANRDFYGKAIQRIPVWAVKSNQYNHNIIRAYFKAVEITGRATIDMMEQLYSAKNNSRYVCSDF